MGRFCLFSFIFQLPFYTLVFSEWGCFFLLVRLGRGDTKDFLSLSKKVPPQLSGFWLFATVAVGVCGTRSAQTVLALFPPSSLRLHRPIKAESGVLPCILTPSPFGHSPYIPLRKHRGRGGLTLLLPLLVFLIPLLVATLLSSPLYFLAPHPAMLRGTAGGD